MSFYQTLDEQDEYNQEFLGQLNHPDEKVRFVTLMNIGDEKIQIYYLGYMQHCNMTRLLWCVKRPQKN